MTIAAGFRFSDGLLLCADSEITHGAELKTRGSKIFPYNLKESGSKAVFTFSGDVALSRLCIQKIVAALADDPPNRRSLPMMFDTAVEQIYLFHHKHIYKHPRYGYADGPSVNLIAGMWSATDGQLGLYQSSEEALFEVADLEAMAVTGTGSSFANYVARPLVPHGRMGLADLITVATFALREAKDNVPGCGKSTEMITISKAGEIGNMGWLHSSHVESFADAFQMGVKHLFVETCDLDTSEENLRIRFDMLWTIIQGAREHLKNERFRGEGFGKVVEMMIKHKTKDV